MSYFERRRIRLDGYEAITGVPERDLLISALKAVELREGERRGWKNQVRLWTVHLVEMDEAVEIRPVPDRSWRQFRRSNPADDVAGAALRFPQPPADLKRSAYADAPDGIAAVAFMHEGWAVQPQHVTEQEWAAKAAGQRVFAANPHRVEVRMLSAVDINGCGYLLARFRDEDLKPVILHDRDDIQNPPPDGGPGQIVKSLARLAYAARSGAWPR